MKKVTEKTPAYAAFTGRQIIETAEKLYGHLHDFDMAKSYCRYFAELSAIPRPSCREQGAAAYIQDFALARGLEVLADEWGNTIIRKPGSAGREKEPWLMLQAHVDMVPAIDPHMEADGFTHDWEKDPLELYTENGCLKARGTTLGADDGVGAAYMLAILADQQLSHPPLECVFTVMEEIGLVGAMKLHPEDILSRRVISLDGGGETATMCCAAGGIKGEITLPLERMPAEHLSPVCQTSSDESSNWKVWTLELSGFQGGHSGIEISKERGNAILLAARLIQMMAEKDLAVYISAFDGGSGDNVIPAAASLKFLSPENEDAVLSVFNVWKSDLMTEYRHSDSDFSAILSCSPDGCLEGGPVNKLVNMPYEQPDRPSVLTFSSQEKLLSLLCLLPNGISAMSIPMPGIPVTSNNIGTIHLDPDRAYIQFRARSLLESGLDEIMRKIQRLCTLLDAHTEVLIRYPGWNYQENSPLRDALNRLVEERYHTPLIVEGTHGGNETGIWYGLHPDSDIVSIGSIEEGIHTPEECLNLTAFDRMYELLTAYIAAI